MSAAIDLTADQLAELLESAYDDVGLRLDCKTAMLEAEHATPTMRDLILAARTRCIAAWHVRDRIN